MTILEQLKNAIEALVTAEEAWLTLPEGEDAEAKVAIDAAHDEVKRLRKALRESDCPRPWTVQVDGGEGGQWTVTAASAREALDDVCARYPEAQGTIYVDVEVTCEITGEEDARTVTLDEEEPECTSDELSRRGARAVTLD
ncbi:MAG: hypothetical protein PHR30_18435 [Gallionellaceae bacterium]|nr:hypothetical protein [Gallionellaceae bacterium]